MCSFLLPSPSTHCRALTGQRGPCLRATDGTTGRTTAAAMSLTTAERASEGFKSLFWLRTRSPARRRGRWRLGWTLLRAGPGGAWREAAAARWQQPTRNRQRRAEAGAAPGPAEAQEQEQGGGCELTLIGSNFEVPFRVILSDERLSAPSRSWVKMPGNEDSHLRRCQVPGQVLTLSDTTTEGYEERKKQNTKEEWKRRTVCSWLLQRCIL